MTPGFLASTETTDAQPGCVFFSTDPGEGGLQPLCDSRLGVNTRFVDQEDICVQYLYCESCLRNSDTPHSDTLDTRAQVAAGARVQLAAGTGARFSKGQMWLFASQVKVLPDEQD
ncbi:uncharacterized protein LOC106014051 [Aplysia californica]|uniref:Uncharacterized protein LOC106014051 n=1 Tax=Aplysia californica TaxID=6500 RepID=A0ABM1AF84_APLCA|nr:uncharacterized protein LOC106014051 [Aplysia californica]